MKITHVEAWQVVVPYKEGVLERTGRWHDPDLSTRPEEAGLSRFDQIPRWIVRIHSDDGLTGVGESFRGKAAEAIEAGVEALVGRDPLRWPLGRLPLPPAADYETFEMAIFDLVGKAREMPAYQLLGGARQERIAVDYWASRHAPEDTGRQAAEAKARGFSGIKIKTALASEWAKLPDDDPVADIVRAIREAAGPGFTITVDPNFRFNDCETALAMARELEPYDVLVLEDPFRWNEADLSDYARFRRESPVPVAMHSGLTPKAILAAIAAGAADYFNIGTSMADFVKMAWIAEQADIHVWHGGSGDLGIRDASYLHAALATANCTLPSDIHSFLFEDDLIVQPITIDHGYAIRTDVPGLGVELDENALARYAVGEGI